MIENKLTKIEFIRILKPILKLEPFQNIKSEFEDIFQKKIQSFEDVIEYSRSYNLTYRGINIFISGIGSLSENSVYISLNCKIAKKWTHFFKNPTNDFVTDLKEICTKEFNNLSFIKTEKEGIQILTEKVG